MSIKNPKSLLDAATALPAAIESKLPAGAPKISTKLLEFDNQLPAMPDFPKDLPDLPAIPELPAPPALPNTSLGMRGNGRRYVNSAEVNSAEVKTVQRNLTNEAGPGVADLIMPPVATRNAPASSILQPAGAQGGRGSL
jgi:hypothetical protein